MMIKRKIIDSTLALLELPPPTSSVGNRVRRDSSVSRLAKSATSGVVSGIDFSPEMVQQAQRRFWRQIAEGRIQMQLGSVPQLSFPDASFDRILSRHLS
jgi:hypothetical protein